MNTTPLTLADTQHLRPDGRWQGFARVEGMDCAACALDLEQAARHVQGLDQFEVNPASGWASWVATGAQAITAMAQQARRLGYGLTVQACESTDHVAGQRHSQQARSRLLRFLVALLAMMQIMMYSAPEYLYSVADIGTQEASLLRWAQWVIALPLVLYCVRPYVSRAWRAARDGRLVMDQLVAVSVWLAFVLSSLRLTDLSQPVWFDSVAMLLTLLLGVQWWMGLYTAKALTFLAAQQSDFPVQVAVWRNEEWAPQAVSRLASGDRIRLSQGQVCPVDAQLPAGAYGWLDESMRTGEADPVYRQPRDWVLAGSRVLSHTLELEVRGLDGQSSLGQLGHLLRKAVAGRPGHRSLMDRALPWFVGVVALCALGSGLWWAQVQGDSAQAWSAVVAVLMVTCPCALALAQPLVRLFAMRNLAASGVLIRNPEALDRLHAVRVLALDKTGTLTSGTAQLRGVEVQSASPHWQRHDLLALAVSLAGHSMHPLSRALMRELVLQARDKPLSPVVLDSVREQEGLGLSAHLSHHAQAWSARLGSARHVGALADCPGANGASQVWLSVAPAGQAGAPWVLVRFDLHMPDSPNLAGALAALKSNYAVHVVSGDRCEAVETWSPELLFTSRQAELDPQAKTEWIAREQAKGLSVLMMGDGMNDAAPFAQADVSVAAAGASNLSASQADLLMLRPGLTPLQHVLGIGRWAHRLGAQNLVWSVAYNLMALPLAMSNHLNPWMAALGMGLSSAVVVANSLRLGRLE